MEGSVVQSKKLHPKPQGEPCVSRDGGAPAAGQEQRLHPGHSPASVAGRGARAPAGGPKKTAKGQEVDSNKPAIQKLSRGTLGRRAVADGGQPDPGVLGTTGA